MHLLKQLIQWRTASGNRITIDDITITPQSQALIIRWPYGGWVWNRPVAVVVEQGGQLARYPIMDITRMAQLILLGLSLLFTGTMLILSIRQRRD